jgi:hypothetical protein
MHPAAHSQVGRSEADPISKATNIVKEILSMVLMSQKSI